MTAAADELEYVPNHAGRSLRTARSGTLALVAPNVAIEEAWVTNLGYSGADGRSAAELLTRAPLPGAPVANLDAALDALAAVPAAGAHRPLDRRAARRLVRELHLAATHDRANAVGGARRGGGPGRRREP